MPTLNWIGKKAVINHDRDVPFHLLQEVPELSFGDRNSGNLVIQGDNLIALKSLLPYYAGRVKCIYIDPPYNTGNEGWVYNDNVNDPEIRAWINQVVGKEAEDLSRHDKWLCMMYPRLKLLRDFLRKDGSIWISIDDNEVFSLKQIMDEIFGAAQFVADISWQRTYSTRNDSKGIVSETEHILVYSRLPDWQPNKLARTEGMNASYKNPDNDVVAWTSSDAFAPGAATHQGMVYAIQHPFTGRMIYPTNSRCWTFEQRQMLEYMQGWCEYELRDLHDADKRAKVCGISPEEVRSGVMGIVLTKPLEESRKQAQEVYERGQWPRFYFTSGGKGGIRRKTYLENVGGRPPTNLWEYKDVGHTDEAKKEILSIFNGRAAFDTPKPSRLIQQIIQVATNPGDLVLDSFAGSGTTGHAILKQNAADQGQRNFIMVEMLPNVAEEITSERVRRVSTGYTDPKGKEIAGLGGGGFRYYRLGNPLFDEYGNVFGEVSFSDLAKHVYFSETGSPLPDGSDVSTPFIGAYEGRAIYLLYNGILRDRNPRNGNVLTREVLSYLPPFDGPKVVYGTGCRLSAMTLRTNRIEFKQIPYELKR
jgi:adenine-specific DNA-methyltransferase